LVLPEAVHLEYFRGISCDVPTFSSLSFVHSAEELLYIRKVFPMVLAVDASSVILAWVEIVFELLTEEYVLAEVFVVYLLVLTFV
jgi:multisubunit Na+/H+ antiporter MnhF subunit